MNASQQEQLATRAPRRMVILTEGVPPSVSLKTSEAMLRYRPEQVAAVLDSARAGQSCEKLFGLGGSIPIVRGIEEVSDANTLLLGAAPPGGRILDSWREIILTAIDRGWNVISGLHQFLCDDVDFARCAAKSGAVLVDIRKNNERDVATFQPLREECLRILTVGQDCNIGKMLVSYELTNALNQAGVEAKFVATGQTGILLEGDGCPVDSVVSDFLNGAAEKLVLANQHHEVLMIEGQGSVVHPRYSAVTLGLLHGCRPHGMILCYEVGRTTVHGLDHVPLMPLAELIPLHEQMASVLHPSRVIAIAMNSRKAGAQQAEQERQQLREELGLPVCDVIRHGPAELVEAIMELRTAIPAN